MRSLSTRLMMVLIAEVALAGPGQAAVRLCSDSLISLPGRGATELAAKKAALDDWFAKAKDAGYAKAIWPMAYRGSRHWRLAQCYLPAPSLPAPSWASGCCNRMKTSSYCCAPRKIKYRGIMGSDPAHQSSQFCCEFHGAGSDPIGANITIVNGFSVYSLRDSNAMWVRTGVEFGLSNYCPSGEA